MLSHKLFILLLLTFPNLIFTQISFTDPISSGTTCLPQVIPTGLQVTCTGKGFFILDPLLPRENFIKFKIQSRTTEIGVGFGQRPDSNCFSTMFPVEGGTWATCTPPSSPASNLPCNTNQCYFNQITPYTSSDFHSQLTVARNTRLQDLMLYQWALTPPNCPITDTTKKCWQIQLTLPGMTTLAVSMGHLCGQAWYSYTCNTPPSYALYLELEGDGNAVLLFQPSSPCSLLSHCLSCPDNVHCQYCEQGYYVSFDQVTCTPACPLLSSGVGTHCKCVPNAIFDSAYGCDCDSSRHFAPSSTQDHCECVSGYFIDDSQAACLPLCSAGSRPPYCIPCHLSCETCSGPEVNECLMCPSGYYLTSNNECAEEDYELYSASKAGKVGKTISTVGMIASSAASVGSSEAVRTSLIGKMFKYLRYLDIAYPKNLRNLLHSKPSDFLSAKTGIKIPESLRDEESYDRAPWVYRRYIDLPSSFLVNFWEDILMLLILSVATLLVSSVDFLMKRSMSGGQKGKKPSLVENISGKVSILAQSFLIIYMYKDGGDVVFFQILDFRTMNSYSGAEILNPLASIIFLIITITLIGFHYYIIARYQSIKSEKKSTQALEEYIEKKEKLQIFFKDYKDDEMIHQSFLLILVIRDIAYNFMLGLLFEYPLIQTLLFPCYSFIMLLYITIGRPFKRGLDNIQHFTCEILLFVVNICVMILAIMDSVGSEGKTSRDNLGATVIVINCLFNYVPTAFLALKIGLLGYEFYHQRNPKNEPVKGRDRSPDSHYDSHQISMMELVRGKGNLDISQEDYSVRREAGQIFLSSGKPSPNNEQKIFGERRGDWRDLDLE